MLQLHSTSKTMDAVCKSIQEKRSCKYLRFGDGDFSLMEGGEDQLASASEDLAKGLHYALSSLTDNDFLAINYHTSDLGTLEPGMRHLVHETEHALVRKNIQQTLTLNPNTTKLYSATAPHHAMAYNPQGFVQMLEAIQAHGNVVFMGNHAFPTGQLEQFFGPVKRVDGPPKESFLHRERILAQFEEVCKTNGNKHMLLILALGCGGRAMMKEIDATLQNYKIPAFIFDIGSPIDVLMGECTRHWISLTNDVLNVNYIYLLLKKVITPFSEDQHSIHLKL